MARRSRSLARRRKVAWGILGIGAVAGAGTSMAAGYFINASANPPRPTTAMTYASNAATGAAFGLALGGVVGGVMKRGVATVLTGILGGAVVLGGAAALSAANTSTAPGA